MRDLHMHSTFSDGKNTPEEMILAAIALGLDGVGLSEHSFTRMDDCGVSAESAPAYQAEMARLKAKYAGKIEVLCGLEQDYYSDDVPGFDYVIGSVHWLGMPDGHMLPVDWTPEKQREGVLKYFGGDWYAFAEAYFEQESRVAEVTKCDIIGHFDLVAKYSETQPGQDLKNPRYVRAWQAAADQLLQTGKTFEINTGAIARKLRTEPYPSVDIIRYLKERGAKLVLSSDSHSRETIAFQFDRWDKIVNR